MKIYIRAAVSDVLEVQDLKTLERITADPRTPSESLDKLARREAAKADEITFNYYVLVNIAENPNTSADTLDYMVSTIGHKADLKRLIASNPNISKELMYRLAKDKNISVVFNLLYNPNIAVDILEQLVDNSKDYRILQEIAKLPTTPVSLLRKLARYDKYAIAADVAKNPNTPVDVIEYFATDPSASSFARGVLASDPNSSPELLRKVYKTEPDYPICTRLIKNPNTPRDLIPEMIANNKDIARDAARSRSIAPDTMQILLQSDDFVVMQYLAENPGTPAERLIDYANSPEYDLRAAVASNPSLPISSMQKLSRDRTKAVRYALVRNKAVPNDILEKLVNDRDPQIHYIALDRLGRQEE